ncbi:MAG: hypothetical protein ACLPKE_01530 [Streptosporangiaceae bacterium]
MASAVRIITHIHPEEDQGLPWFRRAAGPARERRGWPAGPAQRRRGGRVVDVADHNVNRAVPDERGQYPGDPGGQFGHGNRPPGPDLHRDPAATDLDAPDDAAGQVRGNRAELAAVQPGHPRARPDGRGHGVDVDAVDDRGIGWAGR